MTPSLGQRTARPLFVLLLAGAVALAFAPTGFGFSGGITTEDAGFDPTHGGCTSCHGGSSFASQDTAIAVTFMDADGAALTGPYDGHSVYTITVSFDEINEPGASNRAGFNFFIDAGTLAPLDDEVKVTGAGNEAAHTNPSNTEWTFEWTPPEHGAATWRLFVNDVDGSAAPDAGDMVYLLGGWLTDEEGAMPGAVEEHEVHVGVPLPQYWLGLIALAGMLFIMLFGFFYLKFASPHNADQKDR